MHPARWLAPGIGLVLLGCSTPRTAARRVEPAAAPRDSALVVPANAADLRAVVTRPGARVTLLNVWATWCIPCREELPALLDVARARRAEGLRLVLVSADPAQELPEVRRVLTAQGVTDTTYLKVGKDMEFIDAMNPKWTGALPATFVYDRSGALNAFWEGAADRERFNRAVDAAANSEGSARP